MSVVFHVYQYLREGIVSQFVVPFCEGLGNTRFFGYAHWWWIGGQQIPSQDVFSEKSSATYSVKLHEDLEIKPFILVTCRFSKWKYSIPSEQVVSTHQVSKILTALDPRYFTSLSCLESFLFTCSAATQPKLSFSPAARTPWCMSDLRMRSIRRVFLGLNDMISAVSSTVYRNPLEHCILACPKKCWPWDGGMLVNTSIYWEKETCKGLIPWSTNFQWNPLNHVTVHLQVKLMRGPST